MKTKHNPVSKKHMPKDLKRVTNNKGQRVWITGGHEYKTLAEVTHALNIKQG